MDRGKTYIVVLWDGSEQAENAYRHAQFMRKKIEYPVLLVRIVKEKGLFESKASYDMEVERERELLKSAAEELGRKYGIVPDCIVKQGAFKNCMKEVLNEYSCSIIISPETYSIPKGEEVAIAREYSKYGDTDVAVLVTNKAPQTKHSSIEIVIPMEHEAEFKDVIDCVIAFSRKYECNFNFVKPVLSDAQPKRELLSNIYFTKQVLEANNIVYGIKSATGSDNFVDEIFSFAGSIEADYILTTSINYGLIRKNPKYGEVPIIWINPHKRLLQNFN